MTTDFRKLKAIERENKKRLLEVNPDLDEDSGIYFLTRIDENGIKYAYVGQAKHILTRLAQHLVGFQHIDLSIRKHGFYTHGNPYGYKIGFLKFSETDNYVQPNIHSNVNSFQITDNCFFLNSIHFWTKQEQKI